ncbi:hypothetical protein [Rhizorhabdus wittichii]
MLTYWANPTRADTESVDGELTFAGACRSIFEAFGLPWIGGNAADISAAPCAPLIVPQPIIAPTPGGEPEETEPAATPRPGTPLRPARPVVTAPKPKRLMPNKNELEQLREQIGLGRRAAPSKMAPNGTTSST